MSCKKENVSLEGIRSATTTDNAIQKKTDGIITLKTGILPPVTQSTFIPINDSSITQFQIISSRLILLRRLDFTAPKKFIKSTLIDKIYNYKVLNDTGTMTYFVNNFLTVGTGALLNMNVYYNPVNSVTSGSNAHVTLQHISYITEDNVMHDFYPSGDNKSKPMCLVYNVLHIKFHSPSNSVISNGFKEIAEVNLTGDTNWVLNALPFTVTASPNYNGTIPKSLLVIKYNNKTVATKSDSIKVDANSSVQTVFHFTGGFKHTPHTTETLKIYAPVSGTAINFISTMNPYSSLKWTDGLGTNFLGTKNDKFYKANTGFSSFVYYK